jgi:aryl-alcohol dehydrogenase-like predicted oxidoreductase
MRERDNAVWSPLASGRLTGNIRRGPSVPEGSRRGLRPKDGPFVEDGHLFSIIEAIDEIARETRKSVTQIALNWLLQRPSQTKSKPMHHHCMRLARQEFQVRIRP